VASRERLAWFDCRATRERSGREGGVTTLPLFGRRPVLPVFRSPFASAVVATIVATAAPAAAWAHSSGSLKLTLCATWRQLAGYRSDTAAWIALTVPLERIASPRAATGAISGDPETSPPPREPTNMRPSASKDGAVSPHAPSPPAPSRTQPSRAPLFRLSSRLARQVVRAALRAAGRSSAERWLDGLATRSRTSSLLPELRLRAGRTVAESLRLSPTTSDPYRFVQAGGTDLFFDAQLTWDLDRLVFANEELAIERLKQQRDAADAALVRRVLDALFAWQRAAAECADRGLSVDERSDCTLRALEAAITLDVLTGGWFTESMTGGTSQP
jgi:hypothetical protein